MQRSRGTRPRGVRRLLTVLIVVAALVGWQLVGLPQAFADGPTTFTNTTSIAVPATGSANQTGPASPYPSTIAVSGLSGAVSKVTVTLANLTHSTLNDVDAMLVSPTGQNLVFLSDIGDPNTLAFASNATLTFDDAAAASVPTGRVATGTYKPTNTDNGVDTFPAPGPSPSSQTTLAGAFTGIDPNGSWQLFVVDDTSGDIGTIAGGWSLTVTTDVAAVATTTTVTTSDPTTTTGSPATFTATVQAGATPVTAGTVQFADGATNLGAPVALNGSGQAALTTSALTEGTHTISATYSGATGFLTSNGSVSQRVDNATVVTGNTFCNPGGITVPALGPASPYPSNITVSGLSGQVISVTATLKGLSHQAPLDLDIMLAGPTPSKNLLLMSDAGGQSAVSNLDLTFDDAAAGPVPVPAVSGTFKPTNSDDGSSDAFAAPAPAPSGATTLSTFAGASGNGQWSLWVNDDASGDAGSIASGWCLTVVSKAATTTSVTSSANPSTHGAPVTLTASVASGGAPVTTGTVQFADGGTALGTPVAVTAAGTAALTTSALTVGSHAITAAFSGTDTLTESAGSLTQVVDRTPTVTTLTSGTNPADVGSPVQLTATVTAGGGPVSTGTVQFADGGTALGAPVAVAADGTATLTTSALTAGTHTISATYSGDANLATSSGSLQQVVNRLATATTVTSAPNPSSAGATVTLTATVTSGGAPVTAGSVQFSDGATALGAPVALAADGTATLTTSALTVGSHTISAAYQGTTTYAGSTGTATQVVDLATTTTTVTTSPNPSQAGDPVTITATVTSGGAPVTTGSVQLSDGATALGAPVALAADGTATLTTSALTVGSHTISAAYQGTTTYAGSTGTATQVVDKATTTTTLTSNLNPSTLGDPVQLTATVTSGGAPVGVGTVQFADGATLLGAPVTVAADGTATISTMDLTVGSHDITATYSGSDTFVDSAGTLTQVVDKASTTTTLTSGANPSTHGSPVALTATVTSGGAPVTAGTVEFTDGATSLGAPVTVAADGTATLIASGLAVGSHTLTATYGGTDTLSLSAGTLTQVVDKAATTTTVTSDLNPSALGEPVTFTATVTTASGSVSTGAVQFADGGAPLGGPVPVAADGTATSTTSALTVGSHTITATYSGDANLTTSDGTVQQDVGKAATATALTSSLNPSTLGDSVTFTALVTSGGAPISTGTVQFADEGTSLGAAVPVAAGGTATLTTTGLTVGSHAITATYSGDANLTGSTGTLSQVVDKASSTTALTSDTNPSTLGAAVQLTATVASGIGPVTTGTVQFADGATPLGAAVAVAADGTATLSTTALTVGTHALTATYSGDANLTGSSGTLSQVVDKATTTTALTSNTNPSTLGDPVQLTATVTSGIGPVTTGTVQFADGATLMGAPVNVAADGTATISTMDLTVGSHSIAAAYSGSDTLTGSAGTLTQVVDKATTTTTVTTSPNPSAFGDPVTFTATVTSGIGPVSTGTVQFSEGATSLGAPATVAADGTATLVTATLTVGPHTVTATFSGDPNLQGSSDDVQQVVDKATTTTALTSDANPSTLGDPVQLTATVTSGSAPVSTGTVQFTDGASPLGAPVTVAADGTATLSTAVLTVGTHALTATYSGSDTLTGSSGTLSQVVGRSATTTTVASDANPSAFGDPVQLTATVTSRGAPVSGGTVQWSDGGTALGSPVPVAADGTATLTTSALAPGTHTLTAAYSGSADDAASVSSPLEQGVLPVADAGGPYTVAEGGTLSLDGSASSAGATIVWDLNGDGDFTDASGSTPTVTWAQLEALGINDGPAALTVTVRASLGSLVSTSTTTLQVTNTAPSSVLTGSLRATVGVPFTIKVGAHDPSSADTAASFTYTVDWGDGSPVLTVVGPADPPVTHTYTAAGSYAASFTATDRDGGAGDPTGVQVVVSAATSSTTSTSTSGTTSGSSGTTSPSTTPPLAHTGLDLLRPLLLAVLLVLLGAGCLTLVSRRGRHC